MVQVTSTPVLTTARKVGGSVSYYIDGKLIVGVGATIPLASLDDWARGYIIRGGPTEWDAYDAKTVGAVLIGDGTDIISDTTPTLVGLLTLNAGLALGGASAANVITIPDDIAQALNLVDAGGLEYLRIVSIDAQRTIAFNNAADNVDFHVGAIGVADAFQVQGSDGQITLGALGAGFVQSTAGGVLSSGAIIAGDLPAHTHAGAATGGALAVGTTVVGGVSGGLLFPDAGGVLKQDATNLFWVDATNRLGVGIVTPDGTLHVHTATAGAISAGPSADDLVVENSASGGISILTPDAELSSIYFGSPSDNTGAIIRWQFDADAMTIGPQSSGGELILRSDAGATGAILRSTGEFDFIEYIRHYLDTGDNTWMRFQEDQWTLTCGGVTMIDAVEAATDYLAFHNGLNFIGDTVNTKMTVGLTINMGGSDNEATTWKSSDVAHGMTDETETDSFGTLGKAGSANGGIKITGYTEATIGAVIVGAGVTDDTTKSTAALSYVDIRAYKRSGTTVGNCGADANLVVIRNYLTSRFIFDAEGTGHADVSWVTFSDRRLKRDIAPTRYGLAEVLALQPVDYVLKDQGRAMVGLIAQDVYELVPEATRKPQTADSFWSLDHNALVPVLVRGEQELHAEIVQLRERVQELENAISTTRN